MSAKELFEKAFNNVNTKEIKFDHNWSNGTGYFDFAVIGDHVPTVPSGTMVKTQTPHGRKIIIIGTILGNVVVFQRYDGRDDIYVLNTTTNISHGGWFESGRLDDRQMSIAVGEYGDGLDNIGNRIKQIYDACKKTKGI